MPQSRLLTARVIGLACLLAATGCQTYKDRTANLRSRWLSGQYAEAAREYDVRARKAGDSKDAVIWKDGGRTYAVVADADRGELEPIVQYVKLASHRW